MAASAAGVVVGFVLLWLFSKLFAWSVERLGRRRGVTSLIDLAAMPLAFLIVNLLLFKAMMFDSEGEPRRAYEALEEARSLVEKQDLLAREWLGRGPTTSSR